MVMDTNGLEQCLLELSVRGYKVKLKDSILCCFTTNANIFGIYGCYIHK